MFGSARSVRSTWLFLARRSGPCYAQLILHAGRENDIVERLITQDEKFLCYEQELYAGGRVVKREEEFPVAEAEAQS